MALVPDKHDQFKAKISCRVQWRCLEEIDTILNKDNKDNFKKSCFGHLMGMKPLQFQGQLMLQLLFRQDSSCSTDRVIFHINNKEAEFGPKEFALITGLHFGVTPSFPKESNLYRDVFKGKKGLVLLDIEKAFEEVGRKKKGKGITVLKLALLYVLYGILLVRDRKSRRIDIRYIHLVDKLEAFNSFSWGRVVFEHLVQETRRCMKKQLKEYQKKKAIDPDFNENMKFDYDGFTHALQVWAYEIMPDVADLCATRLDQTKVPRMLQWKAEKIVTSEELKRLAFFNLKPGDRTVNNVTVFTTLEASEDEKQQLFYQSVVAWQEETQGMRDEDRGEKLETMEDETAKEKNEDASARREGQMKNQNAPTQTKSVKDDLDAATLRGLREEIRRVEKKADQTHTMLKIIMEKLGCSFQVEDHIRDGENIEQEPHDQPHDQPSDHAKANPSTPSSPYDQPHDQPSDPAKANPSTPSTPKDQPHDQPSDHSRANPSTPSTPYDQPHDQPSDPGLDQSVSQHGQEDRQERKEEQKEEEPVMEEEKEEEPVQKTYKSNRIIRPGPYQGDPFTDPRNYASSGRKKIKMLARKQRPSKRAKTGDVESTRILFNPNGYYPSETMLSFTEWWSKNANNNQELVTLSIRHLGEFPPSWFRAIYKPDGWLGTEHINALISLVIYKRNKWPDRFLSRWTCTDAFFFQSLTDNCLTSVKDAVSRGLEYDWWTHKRTPMRNISGDLPPDNGNVRWAHADKVFGVAHVHGDHWVLYALDIGEQSITVYDSLCRKSQFNRTKSEFDQMAQLLPSMCKAADIWKTRGYKQAPEDKWTVNMFDFTPQQINGNDYGIMAIKFLEALAAGFPVTSIDANRCSEFRLRYCCELASEDNIRC